jgi:hypothetical protein
LKKGEVAVAIMQLEPEKGFLAEAQAARKQPVAPEMSKPKRTGRGREKLWLMDFSSSKVLDFFGQFDKMAPETLPALEKPSPKQPRNTAVRICIAQSNFR